MPPHQVLGHQLECLRNYINIASDLPYDQLLDHQKTVVHELCRCAMWHILGLLVVDNESNQLKHSLKLDSIVNSLNLIHESIDLKIKFAN
jgi:hypothetical protein